jgi:hypothetical protein
MRASPFARVPPALFFAVSLVVSLASFAPAQTVSRSPKSPKPQAPVLIDDFESGTLAEWTVSSSGAGDWFVYTDGRTPPDPSRSDHAIPFDVPNPPQGRFAAVTDMNGPGTRILYREVTLPGRYRLRLTVFYVNGGDALMSGETLAYEGEPNQQFRIDLVDPSAPIDSLAAPAVLASVFQTSRGDPRSRPPTVVTYDLSRWAGRTVRLRLAAVNTRGPLRAGVDDIRLEPLAR